MVNPVDPASDKSLLVYVSPAEFTGSADQLKEFITQNINTKKWWNYVPYLYVIISDVSAQAWADKMARFVGEYTDVIVAEINPEQVKGAVDKGGWAAFKKDIQDPLLPEEE